MLRKRPNDLRALVFGLILSVGLLAIPSQAAPGPAAPPHIDSLSPSSGPIGTSVIVRGTGFTSAENFLLFDGFGAIPHLASSDGTSITFTVPSRLNPYCYYTLPKCLRPMINIELKRYQITVKNDSGVSNTMSFTVTGTLYLPLVVSE